MWDKIEKLDPFKQEKIVAALFAVAKVSTLTTTLTPFRVFNDFAYTASALSTTTPTYEDAIFENL